MIDNWRIWDKEKEYGDLFYKRAVGELPEMESSKALAKVVKELVEDDDLIIDVGCGSGHYLRSLDNKIEKNFRYNGIDQTAYYIERAGEAFSNDSNVNAKRLETKFSVGDIFNLPVQDNTAEIVMCNNVLLHLPSIEKPISELIRISKKYVVIRMLLGVSSFRIKQIESPEEYDEAGEPLNFHYYNIYSENYLREMLSKHPGLEISIMEDKDYDPAVFGDTSNYLAERPTDLTTTVNNIQLNEYVLQPWKFVILKLK